MNAYDDHAPIIGKKLWTIALEWSHLGSHPGTQKDREERIQAVRGRKKVINGSRSKKSAREAVEAAADAIRYARNTRQARRTDAKLGVCYVDTQFRPMGCATRKLPAKAPRGRPPVLLPEGSMDERLRKRVEAPVLDGLRQHYRTDDAGTEQVKITRDPGEVGIRQSTYLDWEFYSRATKHPKKITNSTVIVPRDWRLRVLNEGLASLDGMLTLDAQRIESTAGDVTVYAAVWLSQGRGYALTPVRGYIALGHGQSYHALTRAKAVPGLRRKLNQTDVDQILEDRGGLAGLAQRFPSITVTVRDAQKTGSCDYGIRSWCHRTGLPYDQGEATLAQVYRAYQQVPLPEARAAMLRAVRRHRRSIMRDAA
ncbi:MAG: hypothetical protein FKY71_15360 [Spiribacter salinus]|uniref:Uncharacterized protein n=1 Tax=Spiribacter salinus TaxID=1335746 RepID=A0A540VPN7_9GAMM|nr:MAG: hypothetical protein FKY71_15360 [Spiribacter salinus]